MASDWVASKRITPDFTLHSGVCAVALFQEPTLI